MYGTGMQAEEQYVGCKPCLMVRGVQSIRACVIGWVSCLLKKLKANWWSWAPLSRALGAPLCGLFRENMSWIIYRHLTRVLII